MGLEKEILKQERIILAEIGHEISEKNCNSKYPDKYFNRYEDNLFLRMDEKHVNEYNEGRGSELIGDNENPAKMASIRSSSAMTFNLLGNEKVKFNNNNLLDASGDYSIEYEKQLKTIKSGRNISKANLDAYIVSNDEEQAFFCEMKMLEWFSKNSSNISDSYKDISNYICTSKEITYNFIEAISIIENMKIKGAFGHYDVWQMLKHTLAICNYMNNDGKNKHKKVELLNIVFEPNPSEFSVNVKSYYDSLLECEHEGFLLFHEILQKTGILKQMQDYCFDVKYLSTKEFIDCLDIPVEKKEYLRRYTF